MTQAKRIFDALSPDEIRLLLDRDNPSCSFSNFIGNDNAIDALSDLAFAGLLKEDRAASGVNILLAGPRSVGKTTVAKLFADVLELPFLELQAGEVLTAEYLFDRIDKKLEEEYLGLTPLSKVNGKDYYEIPPMVIFMDEIHSLPAHAREVLLAALEQKTSRLVTAREELDCKNVYWVVATTERGQLPLPFESRFISVRLESYTLSEVAEIVAMNTGWVAAACMKVAQLTKIPRQAIAFSQQALFASKRMNVGILDAVEIVAKRKGIDEDGIDKKQIDVMIALAMNKEHGKSLKSLCSAVGVSTEEMEVHIMPLLLLSSLDTKPLVQVSNRYHITDSGLKVLSKKGLV
jgi:Holliday junction resolvasome RuvABC ATP-dependent DNA helicase subunit